jgi:putative intracellular protease/amidase
VNVEADGAPLVQGRKVAAFTDEEERATGLEDAVPFLLESRLRALGADVRAGPAMRPNAVHDGRLITGQNPMSSEAVARLLLERLS